MITYIDVKGGAAIVCKVRLEKKIIGAIYKTVDDGFYYRPTGGSGLTGDTFPSLESCKLSLEG